MGLGSTSRGWRELRAERAGSIIRGPEARHTKENSNFRFEIAKESLSSQG